MVLWENVTIVPPENIIRELKLKKKCNIENCLEDLFSAKVHWFFPYIREVLVDYFSFSPLYC